MEVVSKMSTERSKRIDHEVKEIHSKLRKVISC